MYSIIRFVQQTECLNCFTDLKENVSFLENSGQIFIAYPTLVFKIRFSARAERRKTTSGKAIISPPASLLFPLSLSPTLSISFLHFPSLALWRERKSLQPSKAMTSSG